jgi:hypothetical protein
MLKMNDKFRAIWSSGGRRVSSRKFKGIDPNSASTRHGKEILLYLPLTDLCPVCLLGGKELSRDNANPT